MLHLVRNQRGLTLIEMLVTLSLFSLASSLIVTSVNHVMDKPKVAGIQATLNNYQLESELLLKEVGETLTPEVAKETLNGVLRENLKFKIDNTSTVLNPYGKPYVYEYKKEDNQSAVIISTEGKRVTEVYSTVVLTSNGVVDTCTRGFGKGNKKLTVITSDLCTATEEPEETETQPEIPTTPIVAIDDTKTCSSLQGTGTSVDPYKIYNGNDLRSIRNGCLDKYYILMNDINLANWATYDSNKGWKPIGGYDYYESYRGSFDGKGYTIYNLPINRPTEEYVSLFGYATGGSIKNLNFINASVVGQHRVSIVYSANSASFTLDNLRIEGVITSKGDTGGVTSTFRGVAKNINVDVDITVTNPSSSAYTGGAFGYVNGTGSATIENVHTTGTINGGSASGGLVGYSSSTGGGYSILIDKSSSSINIVNAGTGGGLVGDSSGTLYTASYATGSVSCKSLYCGGFAGSFYKDRIDDSYATGDVTGGFFAGGFVGSIGSTTQINRAYSTGSSSSNGFAGTISAEYIPKNVFYDMTTSGKSDTNGALPKTTLQMITKSTFTGWNFTSIWGIDPTINKGYPYLKNNLPN